MGAAKSKGINAYLDVAEKYPSVYDIPCVDLEGNEFSSFREVTKDAKAVLIVNTASK